MKYITRTIIGFGVMLVLLTIVGCGKSMRSASGMYVTDDPAEYLELKPDGTYYCNERSEILGDTYEFTGKWSIEKDEITLIDPLGGILRGKIEDKTIIDPDGKIWKKGKRR